MIDFSKMPCKYWSERTKISYLQRRIIVHSILYYIFDYPIISDSVYDDLSHQLVEMQSKANFEELSKTTYFYCMNDFDGSTGFDLYSRLSDYDKEFLFKVAEMVIYAFENKK